MNVTEPVTPAAGEYVARVPLIDTEPLAGWVTTTRGGVNRPETPGARSKVVGADAATLKVCAAVTGGAGGVTVTLTVAAEAEVPATFVAVKVNVAAPMKPAVGVNETVVGPVATTVPFVPAVGVTLRTVAPGGPMKGARSMGVEVTGDPGL